MELPATVSFSVVARITTKGLFVMLAMTISLISQLVNLVNVTVKDL